MYQNMIYFSIRNYFTYITLQSVILIDASLCAEMRMRSSDLEDQRKWNVRFKSHFAKKQMYNMYLAIIDSPTIN